jgi:hypothetical protein
MANPKTFFDITIDGTPSGRIVFEVSLNFACGMLTWNSYLLMLSQRLLKTSELSALVRLYFHFAKIVLH